MPFRTNKLAEALPETDVLISVIAEIELLSFPNLTSSEAKKIVGLLAQMTVIGLDDAVKSKAIALRKSHKIKLPDAIILASAIVSGAEFWTNDLQLAKVPGLKCRKVKLA